MPSRKHRVSQPSGRTIGSRCKLTTESGHSLGNAQKQIVFWVSARTIRREGTKNRKLVNLRNSWECSLRSRNIPFQSVSQDGMEYEVMARDDGEHGSEIGYVVFVTGTVFHALKNHPSVIRWEACLNIRVPWQAIGTGPEKVKSRQPLYPRMKKSCGGYSQYDRESPTLQSSILVIGTTVQYMPMIESAGDGI